MGEVVCSGLLCGASGLELPVEKRLSVKCVCYVVCVCVCGACVCGVCVCACGVCMHA